MNHRPLVLLDIETTGGSRLGERITEIGALRIERGEIVSTFDQLINPGQPIPPYITRLTNITNEMVWQAPTFAAIAEKLEKFLDGTIFVAHSVDFDYGFIRQEFKRVGVNFSSDKLCTVKLSRRLYPEQRRHGLDYVIKRLNLDIQDRHRALADADVLWKFFKSEYGRDQLRLFRAISNLTTYARVDKSGLAQASVKQSNLGLL